MRPQSSMDLAKHIYKLKSADKTLFYTPIEARVMLLSFQGYPLDLEAIRQHRHRRNCLQHVQLKSEVPN